MNAVIVSVLVMIVLSLLRVNVIFALIVSSLVAGMIAGIPITEATEIMIQGMGGQSGTALSYVLLGMFAVMISLSGIMTLLVGWLQRVFRGKRLGLVLILAVIASLSQNAVPVHIAFIPILIPPLLKLFNEMKIDRRAVASALTFGLKFPYITIPFGFGLIYQNIIRDEMTASGMEISLSEVTKAMMFPGAAMIIGLLFAIFVSYRKPKEPRTPLYEVKEKEAVTTFTTYHFITLLAIIVAVGMQVYFQSLVLSALAGIFIMFAGRVVPTKQGDAIVQEGISMMGFIAFIMLIASGYANVLKETGHIDSLVENTLAFTGDSVFVVALVLLLVGLVITLGIGSSFGTIPILAALYVPVFITLGVSPLAAAALIGTAAALGDAGSPASDSTLGPTAGLNADGTHHHIWDTCVPTFLHYNIPLFAFGLLAAVVLA